MKTLNPKSLLVVLTLALTCVVAASGCKKKTPPAPPVADTAAPAAEADTNAAAAAAPAPAPAAPAPAAAPTDTATAGTPGSVPLKDPNAFSSADPNLQDLWNTAINAAQTNGWAVTYNSLMAIRRSPTLSSSQASFITKSINTVGKAMVEAAGNGDTMAAAGLSQLRPGHHQHVSPN